MQTICVIIKECDQIESLIELMTRTEWELKITEMCQQNMSANMHSIKKLDLCVRIGTC